MLIVVGSLATLLCSAGCTGARPTSPATLIPSQDATEKGASIGTPRLVADAAAIAGRPLAVALPDLAARATARNAHLILPAGRYETASTVILPRGTRLELEAGTMITGSLPGRSVVRLGSDSTISGGTVENAAATASFVLDLAENATRVVVRGVRLQGAEAHGVYLDAPGIAHIRIERSVFSGLAYGFLLNPGAMGASDIAITDNVFHDICADAVEVNAATGGSKRRVHDISVTRNRMNRFCGSGPDSGFGIGMAGVEGAMIRDNVIDGARNEGVHLEDGTTRAVVVRNRITGGGDGQRPAVAIYRTVDGVEVTQNRIDGFQGLGIAVLWDAQGSARNVRIEDNTLERVSGDGIVVAGGIGTGPFIVRSNTLETIGGDGIGVAGPHGRSTVEDNLLTDVTGAAIAESLRAAGVTVEARNTVMP